MFRVSGLRHFVIQFGDGFAQGRPLEFEAVGIVNDAIEDGVGEGGFTDDVMPSLDGQLAGDHGCTAAIPFFDDFHQVAALRAHWGIENRVHWVLDVVFHDDLMRLRTDNGPKNMATVKHIAMNLIRAAPGKNSLKVKRKAAAWDHNYLKAIITRTVQ